MIRRTLQLAAGHAAIATPGGIAIVKVSTSSTARIELAVADFAIVGGDELWVAERTGDASRLVRFRLDDGAPIGAPVPLWGSRGVLRPSSLGTASVLWTASPASMVHADGGSVAVTGEWDFVLPVSSNRRLVTRYDVVSLRDPSTERWSAKALLGTGRVIDGAVLLDGRSAVLAIGAKDDTVGQLIVINLHNGVIQHRVTLTGIRFVRFAPARGLALFCAGTRMVYFDLRFGRVLKEYTETRDVLDAALDPAGQSFVVRHGDQLDDIGFGSVADVLEDRYGRTEPATADAAIASDLGLHPPEPLPAAIPDFHRGHVALGSIAALAPRPSDTRLPPGEAVALLDRHGQLVSALVVRAIAMGWDSGRIGFPDEGVLPFRNEVIGILGESTGRAAEEIETAERRVASALAAAHQADAASANRIAPLTALADDIGLSPVARLLLLLIAGPSLWGELVRLYGILGNDEERPMVDEMLLVQILAGQVGRTEIARELNREAPLVRHGLVRIADGRRPFVGLSCDPIVLRILAGDRNLAFEDIEVVHATRSFEDLLIPAATKDQLVRALADAASPARIAIRGRTGSGRHTLLATLAAVANRALGVIDLAPLVAQLPNRIDQLRTALCRAHLLGLLPCVDGLERLPPDDRVVRDLVKRVLDDHPGPLATRTAPDAQPILAPGYVAIDLPVLSIYERTVAWHEVLATHGLFVRDTNELADRFGIGPGVIHKVCARVAELARAEPAVAHATEPIDRTLAIDAAIRQHLETGLHVTATRVKKLSAWSRVVLPADVQDSVLELIARIKHRRTVYDMWGYDQLITTNRGVTALFQGGPGTGKTLVAGAIANELGMDLYRVDLSRIMSKWIGETEQNLGKLFDAAEDGHSIILFDEADSLFAKRTEVKSSVDRYANLEVNYLLQRLDSFEGIAILTTNFGTSIDTAFKRRLSFRLTFPFPDEEAREALWKAHIAPGIPKAGEFDFADLARRYRLSGGYIKNSAIRAAFLAAEEQAPLTQGHLVRAIQAEFREIGKLAESGMLE